MPAYDEYEHGPYATEADAQRRADEMNARFGGAPFLIDLAGDEELAGYYVGRAEGGNGWTVSMAVEAEPTAS
jgi:hypothetical protein